MRVRFDVGKFLAQGSEIVDLGVPLGDPVMAMNDGVGNDGVTHDVCGILFEKTPEESAVSQYSTIMISRVWKPRNTTFARA